MDEDARRTDTDDSILRLMSLVEAVTSAVAIRFGLSPSQGKMFRMLRSGGAGVTAIAQELGLGLPATSSLVSDAETRGLVVRGSGGADRRRVSVELTDKGRVLERDMRVDLQAGIRSAVHDLGVRQRGDLREALAMLLA